MTRSKQAVTVLGALCFMTVSNSAAVQPAHAAMKNENPCLIESTEQEIGAHKFQISKVVVNAPPVEVQAILSDYDHAPSIFKPSLKSCRVVEDNGVVKKIAFSATAPGNLWNLDYVLEVKEQPGYIEWRRLSGSFKKNEGFWKLEPLDNGRSTLVTYAKFIDGGFLMPQMLVNKELRASMPEIITQLKMTAEQQNHVAHKSEGDLR